MYNNCIEFNIDVVFESDEEDKIAAASTPIRPVSDDLGNIIDSESLIKYDEFIGNVQALLDIYDYHVDYGRTKSKTSKYLWLATREEVDSENVPYYIRLRISDHFQRYSKEGEVKAKEKDKLNAEMLKLPETKHKQKYRLREFIVNEIRYATYEEALADMEKLIRQWLKDKGVDVQKLYGDPMSW